MTQPDTQRWLIEYETTDGECDQHILEVAVGTAIKDYAVGYHTSRSATRNVTAVSIPDRPAS